MSNNNRFRAAGSQWTLIVVSAAFMSALLSGCGPSPDLADSFKLILTMMLAFGLLAAFLIFVSVLNFVRPKAWTVVVGFVFGALSLVLAVGSVFGVPENGVTPVLLFAFFTVLLLWSAIYGRGKRLAR